MVFKIFKDFLIHQLLSLFLCLQTYGTIFEWHESEMFYKLFHPKKWDDEEVDFAWFYIENIAIFSN